MNVTWEQGYYEACTLLGHQLVQNELMRKNALFPEDEETADVIRDMPEPKAADKKEKAS